MRDEILRKLVEQAEHYDEELLAAGFTVLAKDMEEYLAEHPRNDFLLFRAVYCDVMRDEKEYWGVHGPQLFEPLERIGLPSGFAKAAAEGKPDLAALGDRAIYHEWTRHPGKRLFERFMIKFKETICGKDGPYEKLVKGLLGQAEIPMAIVRSVLAAGLPTAEVWYPLAVYFSLLLVKGGLKTYCEI